MILQNFSTQISEILGGKTTLHLQEALAVKVWTVGNQGTV